MRHANQTEGKFTSDPERKAVRPEPQSATSGNTERRHRKEFWIQVAKTVLLFLAAYFLGSLTSAFLAARQ